MARKTLAFALALIMCLSLASETVFAMTGPMVERVWEPVDTPDRTRTLSVKVTGSSLGSLQEGVYLYLFNEYIFLAVWPDGLTTTTLPTSVVREDSGMNSLLNDPKADEFYNSEDEDPVVVVDQNGQKSRFLATHITETRSFERDLRGAQIGTYNNNVYYWPVTQQINATPVRVTNGDNVVTADFTCGGASSGNSRVYDLVRMRYTIVQLGSAKHGGTSGLEINPGMKNGEYVFNQRNWGVVVDAEYLYGGFNRDILEQMSDKPWEVRAWEAFNIIPDSDGTYRLAGYGYMGPYPQVGTV
ncbi:MAG: hypothetical protein IJU78_02215, partial [Clostridia bacterium]|nr:hypothetical protein [Clostridia bacterium]